MFKLIVSQALLLFNLKIVFDPLTSYYSQIFKNCFQNMVDKISNNANKIKLKLLNTGIATYKHNYH